MPDVLACEAATLNCRVIKAGTGTSKTFNLQKKKRCALICRGGEVVLDGPVSKHKLWTYIFKILYGQM